MQGDLKQFLWAMRHLTSLTRCCTLQGDLKQFLWAMRQDNGNNLHLKIPPLNHAQKVTMCSQVALGMEHLAVHHRFVHRDLAARNILLQPNLDVKISSLGLCRDVYAVEYFPLNHNCLIPLRWMAPETVYTAAPPAATAAVTAAPAAAVCAPEFSTKSDVWSYGCLIFEIFSLGDIPYSHKTDEEVLTGLRTGDCVLDAIPPGCPAEVWDVVQKCTADCPADRPSFSELCVMLGELTVDSGV